MKELKRLIERSALLGLSEDDIEISLSFLSNREYGLCFDTIITQMYEHDVAIDDEFYELIVKIGNSMTLGSDAYSFMKDLVR